MCNENNGVPINVIMVQLANVDHPVRCAPGMFTICSNQLQANSAASYKQQFPSCQMLNYEFDFSFGGGD